MSETLTHIAGHVITVNGRVIQRCSLCGAKLFDSKEYVEETTPGEEASKFPVWEMSRLVQVTAGNPTKYLLLPEAGILPKDNCIEFI